MSVPLLGHTQGPVLVHTDAIRAMGLLEARLKDPEQVVDRHLARIRALTEGRQLMLPTFNYDFCRTGEFDVRRDPSQVGLLSESARLHADWRTAVPVFSVVGLDGASRPPVAEAGRAAEIDPFGADSVFAHLVRAGGAVLKYGAPLHSMTLIHHIERAAGGPVYRYDKRFEGIVADGDERHPVALTYHVGRSVDPEYDWDRIEHALRGSRALGEVPGSDGAVLWIDAALATDVLTAKLAGDPLWLLAGDTRSWVAETLDALGRRFVAEDFERERSA